MHIVSESEQAAWAGFMLARGLGSSILGKYRIGLVLRANSNTFESIGSNRIKFQFYDLMKPVDQLHQEILNDNLDILICPPSVLSYFVDIKSELKVKRVISVAEVLEDVDRKKIESHFGLTLHQFYSSTEGEIAATCEHGTLHLNEGLMVIQKEWLDEEKGWYHPIITDFRRKSQPIIRYRLNDIFVASKENCPCGDAREVISSIMGRSDDVFHLPKHDGGTELVVPDLIRRAIMQMMEFSIALTSRISQFIISNPSSLSWLNLASLRPRPTTSWPLDAKYLRTAPPSEPVAPVTAIFIRPPNQFSRTHATKRQPMPTAKQFLLPMLAHLAVEGNILRPMYKAPRMSLLPQNIVQLSD